MILTPPPGTRKNKNNNLLCTILDFKELESKSDSNQTGKFSVHSTLGNTYLFIYHYDTNSIHAIPIKPRHFDQISSAWTSKFETLKYHRE